MSTLSVMRRSAALLLAALLALIALAAIAPGSARAHELTMAELHLRETAKGQFIWYWGASGIGAPAGEVLTPRWPEGCTVDESTLRCGAGSMVGRLGVDGVGDSYSAAMTRITWLDGRSRVYTLTGAQPSVQVFGGYDDERGVGEIVTAYTALGVEHILGGIDHLLFVVCLLFLVGFNKRLVWTISAFTAAHSLTLILSALGWLNLRAGPVEAVIALSIVLMAAEALRRGESLTRRLPAVVAFGFGLLHGLGFAGALREIGLPENHLLVALLSFNLGVEFGQLMAVAGAFGLALVARRLLPTDKLTRPVLYGIGSIAAYWTLGRLLVLLP